MPPSRFALGDHGRLPGRPASRVITGVVVLLALLVAGCALTASEATLPPPVETPASPADLEADDVEAWLDGFVPAALSRSDIAGATVAVVADGQVLTTRGYGWADTGAVDAEPVPVDPDDTLFRVGSVSKLVTATAVMQLVEAGELDLDADIDQYLDFTVPRTYDSEITLRHLLTHTPGFEERVAGLFTDHPGDLREHLATDPPEQIFQPGTTPAYSNYGSALAGYIVERVSGMPFDEYVERHIFEPAQMTSASFRQPLPEDQQSSLSQGYTTAAEEPGSFEFVGPAPAGALSASALDMAHFMLAHLGETPNGDPFLDEATLERMHAPALGEDSLGNLANAPTMTLGFFDESRNGHRILGHGGDTDYFHSHLQIYPDDGAGIFISLNSTGTSMMDTVELRALLLAGFADRYFPADEQDAPSTASDQDTAARAEAASGAYLPSRTFESSFLSVFTALDPVQISTLDDGRLLFEPGPSGTASAVFEEQEPWVWGEVDGHQQVAMRAEDGQVSAVSFGPPMTLLPAPGSQRLAVPVLIISAVVLAVTVIAWPVRALVRRRRDQPAPTGRMRWLPTLTRVAAVCAVAALAGWVTVMVTIFGFSQVAPAAIRGVQVLQFAGVVGVIPAGLQLVYDVRHRPRWRRVVGSVLVLGALLGTAWLAFTFSFLSTDISY